MVYGRALAPNRATAIETKLWRSLYHCAGLLHHSHIVKVPSPWSNLASNVLHLCGLAGMRRPSHSSAIVPHLQHARHGGGGKAPKPRSAPHWQRYRFTVATLKNKGFTLWRLLSLRLQYRDENDKSDYTENFFIPHLYPRKDHRQGLVAQSVSTLLDVDQARPRSV